MLYVKPYSLNLGLHIHQNICLKPWHGFIFGPYAHILLMKFFSKNLNFFSIFWISTGSPLWIFKKSKKISNFLKKISLIKNVHMDQKWSHAKVLGKYFEVYGQARPITTEAREKKGSFVIKKKIVKMQFSYDVKSMHPCNSHFS